jgi:hypothetical protein
MFTRRPRTVSLAPCWFGSDAIFKSPVFVAQQPSRDTTVDAGPSSVDPAARTATATVGLPLG